MAACSRDAVEFFGANFRQLRPRAARFLLQSLLADFDGALALARIDHMLDAIAGAGSFYNA